MSETAKVEVLRGYVPFDSLPSRAEIWETHPELMLIPFGSDAERYALGLAKEGYLPAQIATAVNWGIPKTRRIIRKYAPYVPGAETTARRRLIDRMRETADKFLDELSVLHAEKPGEAARIVGELIRTARIEEQELIQQTQIDPAAAMSQSLQLLRGISGPLPAERLPQAVPQDDDEDLPSRDGFV